MTVTSCASLDVKDSLAPSFISPIPDWFPNDPVLGAKSIGLIQRNGSSTNTDARPFIAYSPRKYSCWKFMLVTTPGPGPGAAGSLAGGGRPRKHPHFA